MKKRLLILTLLLAMVLCSSACAESAVLLWEADGISKLSSTTEAVEVYYRGLYGVVALDGQIIIPLEYKSISDSECIPGYYMVCDEEGLNTAYLLDSSNTALTEKCYGDLIMLSEDWYLGVVLELATGEEYDYLVFGSADNYIVSRYDVYYRPNGKVGTLSRDQYARAKAFGGYLLVLNREGGVQLYDAQLNAVESAFKTIADGEYYIDTQGFVASRITGETVASGYIDVSDYRYDDGRVLVVSGKGEKSWKDFWGMIDLQGNVLYPCVLNASYSFRQLGETCYVSVQKDGLYGVYDLEQRAMIIPERYDAILSADYTEYNHHGYFAVEKDGKIGFVDVNGVETVPCTYDKSTVKLMGCTLYTENNGEYTLVAADGTVTALTGVQSIYTSNGYPNRGYYVIAENEAGLWGILDWHGNVVMDYSLKNEYSIRFVDGTHFIYGGEYLYGIQ